MTIKAEVSWFSLHCSPYRATIFLSNPHQEKLAIKVDLIFEEYSTASAIICLTSKNNPRNFLRFSSFSPFHLPLYP